MVPIEKDFQFFGISKDSNLGELKKSYRQLLKKYHPDLNSGGKEYDLKVITIVSTYQRLEAYFTSRKNTQKWEPQRSSSVSSAGTDYALYKKGLFFHNKLQVVDPLDWLALRRAEIASKRNEPDKSLNSKILHRLDDLLHNTSRSIYYFSLLVEEYPSSSWYDDAQAKIAYLNQNLKIFLHTKGYLKKAAEGKRG